MSWTLSANSLEELEDKDPQGQDLPEAIAQADAAKQAVRDLAASGALGDLPLKISLSGHANPGHRPVDGWANDFVSINVYQLS